MALEAVSQDRYNGPEVVEITLRFEMGGRRLYGTRVDEAVEDAVDDGVSAFKARMLPGMLQGWDAKVTWSQQRKTWRRQKPTGKGVIRRRAS